jgi:hypothetical protein
MIYIYMWVRLLSPLGNVNKVNISDVLMEILFAEIIVLVKVATWGQKDIFFEGEEKRGIKALKDAAGSVADIPDEMKGK